MNKRLITFLLLMTIYCNNNPSTFSNETIYPKQLTVSGQDQYPNISPDGRLVAFLKDNLPDDTISAAVQSQLWVMNNDGSGKRSLITACDVYKDGFISPDISWSNKSDEMIITIFNTMPRRTEIWRVTIDGMKRKLSSQDDIAGSPQYSPDGSKLAYLVYNSNLPEVSLYVVETDFTNPILIAIGNIPDYTWNKNSKELLISLYDRSTHNFELWKASIDGKSITKFSNTDIHETYVSYSYDSKFIAFTAHSSEGIKNVNITTSDIFHLQKVIDSASVQEWLPDTNLLLVYRDPTRDSSKFWTESWIVDIKGNVIRKIAEGKYSTCNVSPDGSYLAYTIDGNIWIDTLHK